CGKDKQPQLALVTSPKKQSLTRRVCLLKEANRHGLYIKLLLYVMLKTNNLGYPRIGALRELKKANEAYWAKKIGQQELLQAARTIREGNWKTQQEAGIDLIPSNDFSFYDQVLDLTLTVGAIPARYEGFALEGPSSYNLDLYFAMARGFQQGGLDVTAMEMTKWFDTNYHYIVPEFVKDQQFRLTSEKVINEFNEAKEL